MAQERGEAASHSGVVRGSILGRRGGRQSAKEVVGPRGGAVAQQQPGSLQVLHERDSLEQAIVHAVVGTTGVHRQDGCTRVDLRGSPQDTRKGLTAGSRA